jgi:hypothetical protein
MLHRFGKLPIVEHIRVVDISTSSSKITWIDIPMKYHVWD